MASRIADGDHRGKHRASAGGSLRAPTSSVFGNTEDSSLPSRITTRLSLGGRPRAHTEQDSSSPSIGRGPNSAGSSKSIGNRKSKSRPSESKLQYPNSTSTPPAERISTRSRNVASMDGKHLGIPSVQRGHSRSNSDVGARGSSDRPAGGIEDDMDMVRQLMEMQEEMENQLDQQAELLANRQPPARNKRSIPVHGKSSLGQTTAAATAATTAAILAALDNGNISDSTDATNEDPLLFSERAHLDASGPQMQRTSTGGDEFDLHKVQPPWIADVDDPPSPILQPTTENKPKKKPEKRKSTDSPARKGRSTPSISKEKPCKSAKSKGRPRRENRPSSLTIRDRVPTPGPGSADHPSAFDSDSEDNEDTASSRGPSSPRSIRSGRPKSSSSILTEPIRVSSPTDYESPSIEGNIRAASPRIISPVTDKSPTTPTATTALLDRSESNTPIVASPLETHDSTTEMNSFFEKTPKPSTPSGDTPDETVSGHGTPEQGRPSRQSSQRSRASNTSQDQTHVNGEPISPTLSSRSMTARSLSTTSSITIDKTLPSSESKSKRSATSAAKAALRRISKIASPLRTKPSMSSDDTRKKQEEDVDTPSQSTDIATVETLSTEADSAETATGEETTTATEAAQIVAPTPTLVRAVTTPAKASPSRRIKTYTESEIVALKATLSDRASELSQSRTTIQRLETELQLSQEKLNEKERKIERERKERQRLELETDQLGAKIRSAEEASDQLEKELRLAREELTDKVQGDEGHMRVLAGLREEKKLLNNKNEYLKATLEQHREEIQASKATAKELMEANNVEISLLMEKMTNLQNTLSNQNAEKESLRLELERLQAEAEESPKNEQIDELSEQCSTLRDEVNALQQSLDNEKFDKERAQEEVDILTTNLKRMRIALEGVSEENDSLRSDNDNLRNEIESVREESARALEAANKDNELNFYKDQFARLAAENDELKRALDKATAQRNAGYDIGTIDGRSRAEILDETARRRSSGHGTRSWALDVSAKTNSRISHSASHSGSTSPIGDRFLFNRTPEIDTASTHSSIGSRIDDYRQSSDERRTSGRFDISGTPASSVGSSRNSPLMHQRRFSGSFREEDRTVDELNEQLQQLNSEKERLQAEYSRIPLTGGGSAMRRRKDDLEAKMDSVDDDLSTVKAQLKATIY